MSTSPATTPGRARRRRSVRRALSGLLAGLAVTATTAGAASTSAAAGTQITISGDSRPAGPVSAHRQAAASHPAPAAARAPGHLRATITLCRRYEHITVHGTAGTGFAVKNDNYGGDRECLVNQNRGANFTVTRSSARSAGIEPVAYPFILRGCSWGTCSPRSGLPRRVEALARPTVSWATSQRARGQWNAAFDIWFGKHAMTTGQVHGAELMIWLRARGIGVPAGTPVTVAGHARWYLLHWRTCHGGACWTIIQFRRVRSTRAVTGLRLTPFIARAEAQGWIRPRWWLENIEAGFEIWRGGTGLATDSFMATP